MPDAFWAPAERVTYYVTFPALLAGNLARADMSGLAWAPLMAVEALAVLTVATAMVLARRPLARRFALNDAAFTSLFQGAIRPNTYIGLAVASALFGDLGVTVTAICIAAVVPMVNVLAVTCLARFGHGQHASPGRLARSIATNPLIVACLLGLMLNATGVGAPPVLGPFLDILGRAALPIGLLAVGAGLAPLALRQIGPPVALTSAAKLIAIPLLVWIGALVAGLDGPTTTVAVLYGGLPCSASSYVLARQMGGDAPLMASVITLQTLAAAATIPLIGLLLGTAP